MICLKHDDIGREDEWSCVEEYPTILKSEIGSD